MRLASRTLLTTGLLLGLVVVPAVLATAAATEVVLLLLAPPEGLSTSLRLALAVVLLVVLAALTVLLLALVRPYGERSVESPSVEVDPAEPLWEEVRALAADVGAREPDDILLVPEVMVELREPAPLLGLVGGWRTLRVGAPLLMSADRAQLRALLAHELAHDAPVPTVLARVARRGHACAQSLRTRAAALGEDTARARWAARLADLVSRTTLPVRREQEREADRMAAELTGSAALLGGLRETAAAAAAWAHFLEEFVAPAEATGRRPTAYFEGYAEVVEAPGLREVLETYRADPDGTAAPPGPHDSHVPFAERAARLALLPASPTVLDPELGLARGPALALLHRPDDLLHRLQEQVYAGSDLVPAAWPELLLGQDAPLVRARARALYSAAGDVERRPVTLGGLVAGLLDGRLEEYVRPLADHALDDRPTDAEVARAVSALLSAAVVEALLTTRGATVTRSWGGPPTLVDATGEPLRADRAVAHAVAERDAHGLEHWLEVQGVDLAHRPRAVPGDEPELRVQAVAAPVSGGGVRLLAVLHGGLLLRRATWRDRVFLLTTAASPGSAMLRRFRSHPPAEHLADPASRWHPWEEVERVEARRSRRGMRLEVHLRTSGRPVVVRFERATKIQGEVLPALHHHLADRLVVHG